MIPFFNNATIKLYSYNECDEDFFGEKHEYRDAHNDDAGDKRERIQICDIERILFEQLNDNDIETEGEKKQAERVDMSEKETMGQPAQLGKKKAAFI